jgi:hypothetical protein
MVLTTSLVDPSITVTSSESLFATYILLFSELYSNAKGPSPTFMVSMISLDEPSINLLELYKEKEVRSAGFEPAIPSLGSSYLNQAGPTSPRIN